MTESDKIERVSELFNRLQDGLTEMQSLSVDKTSFTAEEKQVVLEVLFTRDAIHDAYSTFDVNDEEAAAWFIRADGRIKALDRWLLKNATLVNKVIQLDRWREQCGPDNDAWWWHMTPEVSAWDRFDWVWNFATMLVIGLGASHVVTIVKALSVGDLTVASTFSTIAQVGGLAAISQGTLTASGRDRVKTILESLRVPTQFQSEVVLVVAVILLVGVMSTSSYLKNHYDETGRRAYDAGDLNNAETSFMRGLQLDPQEASFDSELGRIYESIGMQESAGDHYYQGVRAGDLAGINNLGRLLINRMNPITQARDPRLAQSFLMLGLQRVESLEQRNLNLEYQFNRNLGWALLETEDYEAAKKYLRKAIALDRQIKEDQIGAGMAYCFLAHVLEKAPDPPGTEGMAETAEDFWNHCVECARPETVLEYRWLMKTGNAHRAFFVDTSKIISGLDRNANQQRAVFDTYMNTQLSEAASESPETIQKR
ncbi:tetratricopeptide repeat protein [Desulfoluna butyratoxydans]|uniref:Tetratricopeptide repeat n=1 Tax=Desulfoluna butyratoxydans TaxID=231438 RepID=A0A4V6YUE2_9BACT|nr:tetratricopeptide repeat protein [Desulfoluna butyratoxydans]VFQ45328.1 tetratricopeptide repeat [Desulfoluna butyratoxydans]